MPKLMKVVILSATALSGLVAGSPALAQTTPAAEAPVPVPAAPAGPTDDIVVTARRRSESAQKVPVSIIAFNADALRQKEIKTVADLTTVSPGAVFISSGVDVNPTLTIRGQTKGYGPGLPAVLTYLNEVPLPAYSSLIPTFDIASVQVLKGPQGTLFGRNTNGGAVLTYTVAPTYNTNGYIESSYGNYNAWEVQGAINLPIVSDKIALRVAGDVIKRDGVVKNVGPGPDFGNRNRYGLRASLLINPTDWLTNTTVVDYYHANEVGPGNFITEIARPGSRFTDFYPALKPYFECGTSPSCDIDLAYQEAQKNGPRKENSNLTNPFSKQTIWGLSNTTTANVGNLTLKNIFGYRAVKFNVNYEADGTELQIFSTPNKVGTQQFTDELQLSGKALNDKLTFIGGAFYLKDKPWGENSLVVDLYRPPVVPDSTLTAGETFYSAQSFALFGQVGYDLGSLIDGLKLNAGFRYTWDTFTGCSTSSPFRGTRVGYDTCRAGAGINGRVKSSAPTWTIGLDYQVTPNIFTYVTSRRGYRGGGFNSPTFSPVLGSVQNFAPEKLTDVEIGLKTNWRSGTFMGRFNVAAYRGIFQNIQQNVIVPVNLDGDNDPSNDPAGQTVIANGGKARIQGVEIDAMISPIRPISFSALAAYTDAKYTSTALPPILADLAGSDVFQYTPKWTYTLSGRAQVPIPANAGELVFTADYYHSDTYLGQALQIPAYHVVNAKLDWSKPFGAPVDVSFFMQNVFNHNYIVAPGVASVGLGYLSAVYADPRTYGVRVRFTFGG